MADGPFNDTAESFQSSSDAKGKIDAMTISAKAFEAAMTRAFVQATVGAKSFEDVLRQLALQISSMAVASAFRPIASEITGQIGGLLPGLFGTGRSSASGRDTTPSNVTVQVSTPDLGSFRRSEAYLSGQIARAVARGQRSL